MLLHGFQNCVVPGGYMRKYLTLMAGAMMAFSMTGTAAHAGVKAVVNLSSQTMTVYVNGSARYHWRVSSGRRGYGTPRGTYSPKVLKRMHYSRKYGNAPMPYSIFFRGGYAIHGTGHTGALGRPASHGCVRLAPGNAARLFALVKAHGAGSTRISIIGSPRFSKVRPRVAGYVRRAKRRGNVRSSASYSRSRRAAPKMSFSQRFYANMQ